VSRSCYLLAGIVLAGLGPLSNGRVWGQVPCPRAVFIANGAGDSILATLSLTYVARTDRLPLRIETIQWSAGDVFVDIRDQVNHRLAGQSLAGKIWAWRVAHPAGRVCLLSHSAGVAVVLAAVECLPPGAVDRVIVLGPGISPWYDLRPALARVREGIDVFYSSQDVLLAALVPLAGTTDGLPGPAAGEVGFAQHISCAEDAGLYCKLHQHAYSPAYFWTGNDGGHCGWLRPCFVRAYLVPMLLGTDHHLP
jgi:hypothetical protein